MPYDREWLDNLIMNRVAEHRHLEYKVIIEHTIVGGNADFKDEGKKEFLRDVGAMASVGGEIVVGMETQRVGNTDTGIPTGNLIGIPYATGDALARTIQNIINSGVRPKIFNLDVIALDAPNGGYIMVIHVPRSIMAPHLVTFGKENRYFHRTSTGKALMDPEDMRNAILFSGGIIHQARKWRDKRLNILSKEHTAQQQNEISAFLQQLEEDGYDDPAPIETNAPPWKPYQILHLIPLSSIAAVEFYPVRLLKDQEQLLNPDRFGASLEGRYNADGFALTAFDYRAGTQFFSTGQIESVSILNHWAHRPPFGIYDRSLESILLRCLKDFSVALKNIGVTPPVMVSISYKNMDSYTLGDSADMATLKGRKRLVPGSFMVPEKLVNEWSELDDIVSFAKPLIDVVWNAAGLPASPNFKSDGTYRYESWEQY